MSSGAVASEDVQHLGGADAVEDVHADHRLPAPAESAGSASPAEMQRRSRSEPAPGPIRGSASSAAYSVGTPPNMVGWWRRIVSSTASGVGRSGSSTAGGADRHREGQALPSPYAKNSLAAENITSSGPMPSTCAP